MDPLFIGKNKSSLIEEFIEKPNLELAQKLLEDKRFVWNSGIFIFKASVIKKEIEKLFPDLIKYFKKLINNKNFDMEFQRINPDEFKKCKNVSIDKATMEKTKLETVLPLKTKWSDLGSWQAIWENSKKDMIIIHLVM